jgi:hypothetical protein
MPFWSLAEATPVLSPVANVAVSSAKMAVVVFWLFGRSAGRRQVLGSSLVARRLMQLDLIFDSKHNYLGLICLLQILFTVRCQYDQYFYTDCTPSTCTNKPPHKPVN